MEMSPNIFVYVIDDDASMRDSICFLLEVEGISCQSFASARRFLQDYQATQQKSAHACIVADLRMPGMSGLELNEHLQQKQQALPMILISGHGDETIRERATREGVFAFLEKPFDGNHFIQQIYAAVYPCDDC